MNSKLFFFITHATLRREWKLRDMEIIIFLRRDVGGDKDVRKIGSYIQAFGIQRVKKNVVWMRDWRVCRDAESQNVHEF